MAEALAAPESAFRAWAGPGMGRGGMGGPGRGGRRLPEQHADGKKVLERISKETGGRLFEVSKKESVDQIYSQIQEELRNQYSLGYTPDRGGARKRAITRFRSRRSRRTSSYKPERDTTATGKLVPAALVSCW